MVSLRKEDFKEKLRNCLGNSKRLAKGFRWHPDLLFEDVESNLSPSIARDQFLPFVETWKKSWKENGISSFFLAFERLVKKKNRYFCNNTRVLSEIGNAVGFSCSCFLFRKPKKPSRMRVFQGWKGKSEPVDKIFRF